MNLLLTAVGAGIAAMLLVIGGYVWVARRRIASAALLRARLGEYGIAPTIEAQILKKPKEAEGIVDKILEGRSFAAVVEEETRRSGIAWTPGQFATYVLVGLVVGSLSAIWLPLHYSLPLGLAGSLAPFVIVSRRRKQRERKVEEQIPEAVEMLVNSMRAGFSLQAGMNFVGQELPEPAGPEFARFYDEQRLGIDTKQALLGLQDRLGTLDARMLVLAILIQRETGGNLGEILSNISKVIRERINFRDHVAVLTAESKMSAIILTSLPILLFFLVQYISPEYIAEITESVTGRLLILYGIVSLAIGYFMLQRLSRVEV